MVLFGKHHRWLNRLAQILFYRLDQVLDFIGE